MNTNQSHLNLMAASSNQHMASESSENYQQKDMGDELVELPAIDSQVFQKLQTELAQIAPDLMAELIHYYLTNTPRLLVKLRQAIEEVDASVVNNTAHMLKSNSARLGAMTCSILCQELETMGQNGSLQGASEKLAELEREYERARIEFELRQ